MTARLRPPADMADLRWKQREADLRHIEACQDERAATASRLRWGREVTRAAFAVRRAEGLTVPQARLLVALLSSPSAAARALSTTAQALADCGYTHCGEITEAGCVEARRLLRAHPELARST